VAIDQRLLHRMQRAVRLAQVFNGKERAAIEGRQELDAGVDRLEAHRTACVAFAEDNRTGAAIAFRAAFLGAGAARVLAQVLEHGTGGGGTRDFADRVAVVKADGLTR
jgi:hypothetical protein